MNAQVGQATIFLPVLVVAALSVVALLRMFTLRSMQRATKTSGPAPMVIKRAATALARALSSA